MAHSKTATIDQHDWQQVPPVVVVIGDPLAAQKGGVTHNAICCCGAKAWVHWPARAT